MTNSKPIPHGTTDGYSNRKCRCADCRAAWTSYCIELRRVRRQRILKDPSVAEHGKLSTYFNWACRCAECRHAYTRKYVKTRPAEVTP